MITLIAKSRRLVFAFLFLPLAHGVMEQSGSYSGSFAIFGIPVCSVFHSGGYISFLVPYCHDDADLLRIIRGFQ